MQTSYPQYVAEQQLEQFDQDLDGLLNKEEVRRRK